MTVPMHIIHVTHTDLDGAGCAVLSAAAFRNDTIDIYYEDYDTVNERLANILDNGCFDALFITDISPREQGVIDRLNEIAKEKTIRLVDHHDTSSDRFVGMDWARFTTGKQCGTLAFYDTLTAEFSYDISTFQKFAVTVNDYDMWIKADYMSDQLNNLFQLMGMEKFVKRSLRFNCAITDQVMYDDELKQAQLYGEYVDREVHSLLRKAFIIHPDKDTSAVIVYSEHFASQLGEEARKWDAFKNCDCIAVIGMNKKMVSFRSIRSDFNVGLYAKCFGGGGNPKTAGLSFKDFKTLYFALNLIGG